MLDQNRKMCVILTNGAQYQFTIRELFSLFTRKEFFSLAFSMVCLMAIFQTSHFMFVSKMETIDETDSQNQTLPARHRHA